MRASFVFREWSMARDPCLLSPGNGLWLLFEVVRRAVWLVTGSVWHGAGTEVLEISPRAISDALLSSVSLHNISPWPLMNPGLYHWFMLSVAAIKFMICQFKIVNGNTEFLQSLNNWVIHTSSISGPGLESGWSEARGRGMWRCNYQLIWPKQVTVRGGGRWVLRRIVLLLVVSAVGLFLSYQWWPTLGWGRVSCLPHTQCCYRLLTNVTCFVSCQSFAVINSRTNKF